MSGGDFSRLHSVLDSAEQFLESVAARSVLSALILVSVLPPEVLGGNYGPIFLCVFGPEFLVRLLLVERRRRERRLRGGEVVLLVLDFLAILTFLPTSWLPLPLDSGALRFLRLGRLLLLLGYWRDMLRELWLLLSRRERRYQIVLVLVLGAILALAAAVLLVELEARHDYDGDGALDEQDATFVQVLWWSFRQVQDPGNLVPVIGDPLLVAMSVLLTFAGLLLFSFFIGIGTTVVEELVERSRSQPLGMRRHTVVLGMTPYTDILLRELADIYRKNFRPYRGAVLADEPMPEALADSMLRHFRYRTGDFARDSDLERVSIRHAKRVIVLGDASSDPDASVISAILATRKTNPGVPLFPNLEHERNFPAARAAGGAGTQLVGSGSMLGHYVAQCVAYPGVDTLYTQLLQSVGCEIYTYIYTDSERRRLRRRRDPLLDVEALHASAREAHHATLLGVLVAPDTDEPLEDDDFDLVLNPVHASRRGIASSSYAFVDGRLRAECLRGFVGIALRFRDLTLLARELLTDTDLPRAGRPAAPLEPSPSRRALSRLRLRAARPAAQRILILGAGPRVPRVTMELIGFFRRLEITILAAPEDPRTEVGHDLRTMLTRAFGTPPRVDESDDDALRLVLSAHDLDAQITLMTADWTHGHRLEEEGVVTLEAADAILLLPPGDTGTDSDGRIALDCLHLANLERTGTAQFRPGAHVLALLRDPAKGELLERRLMAMRGGDGACRYTVVSRELVRQRFVVQSVFVRGLSSIYLEMLSSRGQFLARVVPSDDASTDAERLDSIDLEELAEHLLETHDVLLVGYEHEVDGNPEAIVDPDALRRTDPLPRHEVTALYVLGAGPDLAAMA
ncbi:MAG: hypothetical protein AAGC60_23750 [Acidobacteriota bacterium]